MTGRQMAKMLGRAVSASLLFRGVLSIFRGCYDFDRENWSRRRRLWPSAIAEAQQFAALVAFASADLRAGWCGTVGVADASLSGYAVARADVGADVCDSMGQLKEPWRYRVSDVGRCAADARPLLRTGDGSRRRGAGTGQRL